MDNENKQLLIEQLAKLKQSDKHQHNGVMSKECIDILVKLGAVNIDKDGKPQLRKRAY